MCMTDESMQDDPFHTELATFIDVVDGRRPSGDILSSYVDAIRTYELVSDSWQKQTRNPVRHADTFDRHGQFAGRVNGRLLDIRDKGSTQLVESLRPEYVARW